MPMNSLTVRQIAWLPGLALSLILSGCAGGRIQDQFYLLEPTASASISPLTALRPNPRVGLAPVRIPGYLDRPQIVRALEGHRYELAEAHRWAERLDENIERVILADLSTLLPTDRMVLHPSAREPMLDALLGLQVQAFHSDDKGMAYLSALWSVKVHGAEVSSHRFECRQAAAGASYADGVAAQNACLGRLDRELAGAVRDALIGPR